LIRIFSLFIFLSLFLFANKDVNKSFLLKEDNSTINLYQTKIKNIDKELEKIDIYVKYQEYQKLNQLKLKIEKIEKKLKYLKRYKYRSKRDEIKSLELQKIAYQQQIKAMSFNENNIFDAIIFVNKLPTPFHITNPFEIFSVINYKKEVESIVEKNIIKYEDIKKIKKLLLEKEQILKSLKLDTKSIDKIIKDFNLIDDIYKSKLEQLQTQSHLYIEKMNEEEKAQIRKLVTLLIFIFISIFFFTFLKMGLRKYAKNLENIYLINKILNILNFTIIILIIMFFYIDNATYLVTILGFASAGIAIAMKDWFMNIFGWIVIITTGNFKVGDRIKILLQNGNVKIVGDIIDITISRIVIHEDVTLTTYEYNRRAGRIIFIPNNVIFTNPIFNYTHSGLKTVWDGVDIVITFDSNFKKAEYIIKEILKKYSKGYTDMTRIQLNKLRTSYNIKNTNVEPRVFTFIGEYGIIMSCWYLNSYATLSLRSKISSEILEKFLQEEDIKIAYNTLNIIKKDGKNEQIIETKTTL